MMPDRRPVALSAAMASTNRLVGNTAVQLISPAVRIMLGMVLIAALSRYLGVRGLGAYALVFAYVLIFAGVFNDVGLGTVCLREISADPSRVPTLLTSGAALQLLVAGATYCLLAGSLLLVGFPAEVKLGILIFGLTILLSPLDLLVIPFQAQLRQARLLGPALLGAVVNFCLTISAVLVHGSLVVLVSAAAIASVSQYVWIAALAFRSATIWAAPSRGAWRSLISESAPLAITSTMNAVVLQAPILALSAFGLASVGLFNAANRIPQQLAVIPNALRATSFPLLADSWVNDRRRFAKLVDGVVGVSVLIGVPLALIAVSLAEPLIKILFGPGFDGAMLPFQLLMAVLAILFPGIAIGEAMIAAGHQRTNLTVMIAAFPVLIIGMVLLIPLHGASGAATSLLVYYSALTAGTMFAARSRLGDSFPVKPILHGIAGMAIGLTVLGLAGRQASYAGGVTATLVAVGVLIVLQRRTVRRLVGRRQSWNPPAS
jgi:O-antigen/teichoic acid export membrane protein